MKLQMSKGFVKPILGHTTKTRADISKYKQVLKIDEQNIELNKWKILNQSEEYDMTI